MSMVDEKEDQISGSIKKEYNPDDDKSILLGDHGQLWIKLEINPSTGDDIDEAQQDEDEEFQFATDQKQHPQSNNKNNNIRICQVCNKVFGSGKALGGHMRIHFQTNKDVIFSKKLIKSRRPTFKNLKKKKRKREMATDFSPKEHFLKIKSSAAGFDKNNTKPTCSICGKNFPSMKSLFGHMRCHPEREWRGIQPPASAASAATFKASPPSVSDRDHQVLSGVADGDQTANLRKPLGGWSVTNKRGRKAILENSEEEEEQEMRDAVYHLMSLAQGGDLNSYEVEEFEATNSNSLTYYKTENEENTTKIARKREFAADCPVKDLRNEERELHLDDMIHVGYNNKAVKETDIFAGKLADLDCQWEKNTWPKEYYGEKDDQLLINHKNFESTNGNVINVKSRKKRKRMKLRDLELVNNDDTSPVHDQDNPISTFSPERYRCTTCDKCFPTHQALGGHKSSHNRFRMANIQNSIVESTSSADKREKLGNCSPIPVVDESKESDEGIASSHQCRKISNKNFPPGQMEKCPSDQVTSADEVSSTSRRIMQFDLNKVPSLEEDAAGYGCASYFN